MTTEPTPTPTAAEAVKAAFAADKVRRQTVKSHAAYAGHVALAQNLLDVDDPVQTAEQIIATLEAADKSAPAVVETAPAAPAAPAAPTLSTSEMLFAAGQADAEFLLGKRKAA